MNPDVTPAFCIALLCIIRTEASELSLRVAGIVDIMNITIPFNTTVIDFSNNAITNIPQNSLNNLPNLVHVKFSRNNITTISDYAFFSVNTIRLLNLNRNHLEVITAFMFRGLYNLKHLFLHKNLIHTIKPFAFSDLAKLRTLRLDKNYLQTIDESVFNISNHPMSLDNVRIANNPLSCDCRLLWLLQADGVWLTIAGNETVICDTPAVMKGQSWDTLTEPELLAHGNVCRI